MNKEQLLLSKVIETRDLTKLFERNVNDSWFMDNEDRKVWSLLKAHFTKYGECPSLDVVTENFPSYKVADVQDSIDYLLDEIVARRRKIATITMVGEAIDQLEKERDHEAALISLQRGIVKLEEDGLTKSSDVDITENPMALWDEYMFRKNNPGLLGVPTGFPTIDKATNGLQNGQLIIIVAPPKTGKSTLALQIAQNIHLKGHTPMFQSFEMTNQEQLTRYVAMRARVSHTRYQSGSLTDEEESRVKAKLRAISEMREKFWLVGATEGSTVSAVASKIQILQPDVVFIDGMYLMIDENGEKPGSPQALTNITRSLKRLAQRVNKPVIISTQILENKMRNGQVTTDAIGYSSSFHQDADVIFGLQREDENVDSTRLLKVIASRNSGNMEVSMVWDWNTGAFREIDETDL
jgi:replicative DNA helicase